MDNLTLLENVIAISRIDFNGEEWNYIVLRKDTVINNEQTYKVQWWSKSMGFYWTKYNMSFTNAFNRFYLKVKNNIPTLLNDINNTIQKDIAENGTFISIHPPLDDYEDFEEQEFRKKT